MDIGDIGFLIVAFLVFIVNFIVKAQKDKTQTGKPVAPELTEPWEVTETMPPVFANPLDWETKPDVKKKKTPPPIPFTPESYESKKLRLQSQEGVSSLSESLFRDDAMDSVSYDEESDEDFDIDTIFLGKNITTEFKKGIIYSEILHRKYD